MTGATDWPRDPAGKIDEASPKIAAWRTQVIVDLLARTRAAIDQVEKGTSSKTQLGMDVLVNWVDPAAGRPEAGHDYCRLASVADRLTAWAYFASDGQQPADIEKLTAGLAASGVPIDRFVVSVGLWTEDQSSAQSITGKQLRQALAAAQTHGVTSVNVTPVSLMTPEDWSALEGAWG